MSLFGALKQRSFALLWSGQTISQLGDSLYGIALAWYVLEKTGSAAAAGLILTLTFIPRIVFLVFGGLIVDRFPRAAVILISDSLRGVCVAAAAYLAYTQQLEIWHIYVLGTLFGLTSAFFEPAMATILPDLTPPEALASANALRSLSGTVIGMAGPALGALAVSQLGVPLVFALNSLSFFVSAICLAPILGQPLARLRRPASNSLLADLRAGLRFVSAARWLWVSLVVLALINLAGRSPMTVSLPFLVSVHYHADVGFLGLLQSVFSVGSLVGIAAIGRLGIIRRRGPIIFGGLVLVGLITLALGLPLTLAGAVLAIFGLAITLAVTNLIWAVVLQECVPADMRGRVASISLLASNGLLPLGFALAGWATDALGPATLFILCGLATTGLAVVGLMQPAIRQLD